MTSKRIWRFGVVSVVITATIGAVAYCFADLPGGALDQSRRTVPSAIAAEFPARPLASLAGGGPWLNSPALTPQALRGKVVLVNFWTYSCINSLRPLPYLRDWAAKYRDDGLVVVGVHTPEFGFEKDVGNVRAALADLDVTWPVKLDSDYGTWTNFGNDGWPGFYFIDAKGRVRHHSLGEGNYAAAERLLQQLLAEAKGAPVTGPLTGDIGTGVEASPIGTTSALPKPMSDTDKPIALRRPNAYNPTCPSITRPRESSARMNGISRAGGR
jgi:thiol-disulfide isomerase/thioredoxin